MESQQPARTVVSILGLVMLLAGAVGLGAAPVSARIVLDNDRFVVGSKWNLDVVVTTNDPLSVKFSYGTLPSTLALVDGPNIRETSYEESPGKMSRATRISLTLRTLSPGIQELGPWVVKVGSRDIPVAPVTVFLLAADEAKRRFPLEVRWVVPAGPYYQGQAIPLLLQVRNLDTLLPTQDLTIPAPGGALLEKVTGLGEIEIFSEGEDRIMNLPWGGWMLIPTKEGQVTVPPVRVDVAGLTRTTAPLVLPILPLPEGTLATRAVGNLTYTVEAHEGADDQKGQVIVTQEVQGQGNFPTLVLPPVTVAGLSQLSRTEAAHTKASSAGYEGNLIVTWRFQADRDQLVTFTLPGFQAFQPSTGLVNAWEDRSVSLHVSPRTASTPLVHERPHSLSWNQVVAARPWGLWGTWLGAALLLPGLVFFALSWWLRGRKKAGLFSLLPLLVLLLAAATPPAAPPAGFELATTPDDWARLVADHPEEPGLWYNRAVACSDAGATALAVQAVHNALRAGFQGPEALALLRTLEEGQVQAQQFRPWTFLSADLLYLLVAVFWNLALVFAGLQRLTDRPFWWTLASLAALALLASGVVLGAEETVRWEANAVVGPADGSLAKVPGLLAEKWMSLRGGTVVRILGRTDGDVLIETGYGLEGWLPEKALLPLEGRR